MLEQERYITILADLSIAEALNKIQTLKKVAKIQDNYKYHTTRFLKYKHHITIPLGFLLTIQIK